MTNAAVSMDVHISLSETSFLILLDIHPEAELLDHMILLSKCHTVFHRDRPFYIFTYNSAEEFLSDTLSYFQPKVCPFKTKGQ